MNLSMKFSILLWISMYSFIVAKNYKNNRIHLELIDRNTKSTKTIGCFQEKSFSHQKHLFSCSSASISPESEKLQARIYLDDFAILKHARCFSKINLDLILYNDKDLRNGGLNIKHQKDNIVINGTLILKCNRLLRRLKQDVLVIFQTPRNGNRANRKNLKESLSYYVRDHVLRKASRRKRRDVRVSLDDAQVTTESSFTADALRSWPTLSVSRHVSTNRITNKFSFENEATTIKFTSATNNHLTSRQVSSKGISQSGSEVRRTTIGTGHVNKVSETTASFTSESTDMSSISTLRLVAPPQSSLNPAVIVVGVLVPIIIAIIIGVVVYKMYRKKYPVRMVIGKNFAKFENPRYTKKTSTLSLVMSSDVKFDLNVPTTSGEYDNPTLDVDYMELQPSHLVINVEESKSLSEVDEVPVKMPRRKKKNIAMSSESAVYDNASRDVDSDDDSTIQYSGERKRITVDDRLGKNVSRVSVDDENDSRMKIENNKDSESDSDQNLYENGNWARSQFKNSNKIADNSHTNEDAKSEAEVSSDKGEMYDDIKNSNSDSDGEKSDEYDVVNVDSEIIEAKPSPVIENIIANPNTSNTYEETYPIPNDPKPEIKNRTEPSSMSTNNQQTGDEIVQQRGNEIVQQKEDDRVLQHEPENTVVIIAENPTESDDQRKLQVSHEFTESDVPGSDEESSVSVGSYSLEDVKEVNVHSDSDGSQHTTEKDTLGLKPVTTQSNSIGNQSLDGDLNLSDHEVDELLSASVGIDLTLGNSSLVDVNPITNVKSVVSEENIDLNARAVTGSFKERSSERDTSTDKESLDSFEVIPKGDISENLEFVESLQNVQRLFQGHDLPETSKENDIWEGCNNGEHANFGNLPEEMNKVQYTQRDLDEDSDSKSDDSLIPPLPNTVPPVFITENSGIGTIDETKISNDSLLGKLGNDSVNESNSSLSESPPVPPLPSLPPPSFGSFQTDISPESFVILSPSANNEDKTRGATSRNSDSYESDVSELNDDDLMPISSEDENDDRNSSNTNKYPVLAGQIKGLPSHQKGETVQAARFDIESDVSSASTSSGEDDSMKHAKFEPRSSSRMASLDTMEESSSKVITSPKINFDESDSNNDYSSSSDGE